jgi:hypothetical protein
MIAMLLVFPLDIFIPVHMSAPDAVYFSADSPCALPLVPYAYIPSFSSGASSGASSSSSSPLTLALVAETLECYAERVGIACAAQVLLGIPYSPENGTQVVYSSHGSNPPGPPGPEKHTHVHFKDLRKEHVSFDTYTPVHNFSWPIYTPTRAFWAAMLAPWHTKPPPVTLSLPLSAIVSQPGRTTQRAKGELAACLYLAMYYPEIK